MANARHQFMEEYFENTLLSQAEEDGVTLDGCTRIEGRLKEAIVAGALNEHSPLVVGMRKECAYLNHRLNSTRGEKYNSWEKYMKLTYSKGGESAGTGAPVPERKSSDILTHNKEGGSSNGRQIS